MHRVTPLHLHETPNMIRFLLTLGIVLTTVALPACRSSYIAVPDELSSQNADGYPVTGRLGVSIEQVLSFATYTAGPVDRSKIDHADTETRQSFGFSLTQSTAPGAWSCLCDTLSQRTDGGTLTTLSCSFVPTSSNTPFTLALSARNDDPLTGTLTAPDGASLNVTGTRDILSDSGQTESLEETTGYFIEEPNGAARAAVDVTTQGYVWIDKDLSGNTRLSTVAAAAALLLHRDLRKNIR